MNTTAFSDKGDVQMIAHRGVSGLERENTCPAFVAAGVKSYYGIETDVHVTKDKQFILVHDDDLKRIANLKMSVEESTFAELRKVRLKDTDNKTERADLFLPTVEEYISICKKYKKQAVLELKNRMEKENVWEIVERIKSLGWMENTTFISFFGENLLNLKKRYEKADVQFLSEDITKREIDFIIDNGFDADLNEERLTRKIVEKLHAEGRKVNCWTVDSLQRAKMLKEMGVDQITSNILE